MRNTEVPCPKSKRKIVNEERGWRKDSDSLGRNQRPGNMTEGRREGERIRSITGITGTAVTFSTNKFTTIDSRGEGSDKKEVSQIKNNKSLVNRSFFLCMFFLNKIEDLKD